MTDTPERIWITPEDGWRYYCIATDLGGDSRKRDELGFVEYVRADIADTQCDCNAVLEEVAKVKARLERYADIQPTDYLQFHRGLKRQIKAIFVDFDAALQSTPAQKQVDYWQGTQEPRATIKQRAERYANAVKPTPAQVMEEEFKPCVIENEDLRITEMVLEDCLTIWQPWGPDIGFVDLGYKTSGELVGIKVWDTVALSAIKETPDG